MRCVCMCGHGAHQCALPICSLAPLPHQARETRCRSAALLPCRRHLAHAPHKRCPAPHCCGPMSVSLATWRQRRQRPPPAELAHPSPPPRPPDPSSPEQRHHALAVTTACTSNWLCLPLACVPFIPDRWHSFRHRLSSWREMQGIAAWSTPHMCRPCAKYTIADPEPRRAESRASHVHPDPSVAGARMAAAAGMRRPSPARPQLAVAPRSIGARWCMLLMRMAQLASLSTRATATVSRGAALQPGRPFACVGGALPVPIRGAGASPAT